MLLPLGSAVFALGIGLAIALRGAPAAVLAGAVGLCVAALALRLRRRRLPAAFALAAAAGLGLGLHALAPRPLDQALAAAAADDVTDLAEGRVRRGPDAATRGARLEIDLDAVNGRPARARLALVVLGDDALKVDAAPGDRVRVRARLREPALLANPGLPDPEITRRASGIDLVAGVTRRAAVERVADAEGAGGVRRWALRARTALRAAIDARVTGLPGVFLRAVTLGDRAGLPPEVEAGFRAAGATHVLSVSGLHLAAVATLFFLGVRRLLARVPGLPLHVDTGAMAAALALPAIAFYTLLTGEAVATERSALMAAVVLGARLVRRPVFAPATIAAAAAVLLAASPLVLCDVSFQLSVASVAGLALLGGRLAPAARGRGRGRAARMGAAIARLGAATLAATAATAPLVAHHFGEVAPAAPLGNLVLVPIVELVIVPLGLAGATLGAAWSVLGAVPLAAAGAACRLALAAAEGFRAWAPIGLVRYPDAFETVMLTGAAVLLLWAVRAEPAVRRRSLAVAASALLAAAGSLGARELAQRSSDELRVTFLDVGQGDAVLVEAPGGRTMLVDGGGTYDGSFDPGERVVEPVLRARGITQLDLVVLSHPHPDHMNGLFRVLERFPVGALWTSGDDGRNPEYGRLLALARARGVALPRPSTSRLGPLTVTPAGPFVGDEIAAPPGTGVNDASLVLHAAFAGRAFLFPGDVEGDGEMLLAARGRAGVPVAADVLKVPHHGSRTSSTPDLLDAARPALAVMSLGRGNRFHFPAPEVVARYQAHGATLLRTDRDGAVTVTVGRDGTLRATCERGCR